MVETGRVTGASLRVVHRGNEICARTAGWADRDAKRPVDDDTIFRLASLTKALTSAAAMVAVERRLLAVDAAVRDYLDWFTPSLPDGGESKMTVRHLMTHTGGLSYGFLGAIDGPYVAAGVSDGLDEGRLDLEENIRRLAKLPLIAAPGERWNYSLSTDVLGLLLQTVFGKPLQEVIAETVTGPLGMRDTAYVTDPQRLVRAYYANGEAEALPMADVQLLPSSSGGRVRYAPGRAVDSGAFPSGGAGMVGTARDYIAFLEAMRKGGKPLMSNDFARLMTTDCIAPLEVNSLPPGWGFGLGVAVMREPAKTGSPLPVGTWRWSGVYGLTYFVDVENQLTVLSMTNTAGTGAKGHFHDQVIAAVYG